MFPTFTDIFASFQITVPKRITQGIRFILKPVLDGRLPTEVCSDHREHYRTAPAEILQGLDLKVL
jgi:hypothetical protein